MKRSQSRVFLALAGYVFAMAGSLMLPIFSQPAQAVATVDRDWVYVFTDNQETLKDMNDALSQSGGNGLSSGLRQSYIINRGSLWNPAGFRKFSFNETYSQKLSAAGSGGGRWFAFTTSYYCANNKVVSKKPSSGNYSFVELQAAMNLKSGFARPSPHDAALSVTRFTNYNSTGTGVDYDVNDKSNTGTLAQVARFNECFPPETTLTPTPGTSKIFSIRNITDPQVNDSYWRGAKDKIKNQSEADPIDTTPGPGGGSTGGGPGSAGTDEAAADQCPRSAFNFGWLICPFIGLVNDLFVRSFQRMIFTALSIDPLDSTGPDKNIYLVWKNIRDLANVLFLLIFMVVVMANTLSFNVQAYTIKKMIPKLVAAAILVQFSFVISAVIIDIGNILGNGLGDLINSVANIPGEQGGSGIGKFLSSAAAAIAAVLGGAFLLSSAVGTSAGIAPVAIGAIVLLALTAFFAFVSILFTLVLRKLIIIILIIISPLAFAAMVLPSTEKFFKTWMKTFIQVIMMYPIIVFMFAAATVLQQAVGAGGQGGAGDDLGIVKLMAAAMPIAACFMVPMTFKWGGKIMSAGSNQLDSLVRGKIGGKVVGGYKDSKMYKTPRELRAGNKLEKLQGQDNLPGNSRWQKFQRYKAGVQLRGDYLGGNRGIGRKGNTGLDRFKPTVDQWGDMKRRSVRDRVDYLNAGLVNSALDRPHLVDLYSPLEEGAKHTGDKRFKEVKDQPLLYDQVLNGLGSYIKKEGRLPYDDALVDLEDMGVMLGKNADERKEDQDWLMSIDHNVAKAAPFDLATTHVNTIDKNKNRINIANRRTLDEHGNWSEVRKDPSDPTSAMKQVKVAKSGDHEWHELEASFGQDTFMGDNKEIAVDQLTHGLVDHTDATTGQTYRVRAMDKLLAKDKLLLHNLHTTPTRYGNVKSEAKSAVVDYGRKALARYDHLKDPANRTSPGEQQEWEFMEKNNLHAAYQFAAHFGDEGTAYATATKSDPELSQALLDAQK